jgi:hypothetical protein
MTYQLAGNYSYQAAPDGLPTTYTIGRGFLYANWRLEPLGGANEGLTYLQITATCKATGPAPVPPSRASFTFSSLFIYLFISFSIYFFLWFSFSVFFVISF